MQTTPTESTSSLLQSMGEVPTLTVGEKFTAGYNSMEYGPNLTNALYDIYDNFKHRNDNQDMMTAQDADLLYPVGVPRTSPVSAYRASKAYYRYENKTRLDDAISASRNSFGGTLSGFMGGFVGGIVKDPVMMIGAAGVGNLVTSGTKGMALSANIYGKFGFLGQGALRTATTRAATEAIGSLAWDIPAQALTAQLLNYSDSMGITMSASEYAHNVAIGAMFAGVISGISGLKHSDNIASTAEGYIKFKQAKASLEAEGLDIGFELRDVTPDGIKTKLSEEGHGLIQQLDADGVLARGADGRIYSSYAMAKAQGRLDIVETYRTSGKIVDKAQFIQALSDVASRTEHKDILESFLEYADGYSVFDLKKAVDNEVAPVPFRAIFNDTIEALRTNVEELAVVDNLEIATIEAKVAAPLGDIELGKGPLRGYTDEGEQIWSRRALEDEGNYGDTATRSMEGAKVQKALGDMEKIQLAAKHYGVAEDEFMGSLAKERLRPLADREFPVPQEVKEIMKSSTSIVKDLDGTLDLIFGKDAYKIVDDQVTATSKTFLQFYNKAGKLRIKGSDLGKSMKHITNMGTKNKASFDAVIQGMEQDLLNFQASIEHYQGDPATYPLAQEDALIAGLHEKMVGIEAVINDAKGKASMWTMLNRYKAAMKLEALEARRADINKLEVKLQEKLDPMAGNLICDL